MGTCCCASELKSTEISIISSPSKRGIKDHYRLFEYGTPFYNIDIDSFFQYMALASMDSVDGQTITLQSMRGYLKGVEWEDLDDDESILS